MAARPGRKRWAIHEQAVEDAASGLSLQFKVMPDGSMRLCVCGGLLPFGRHEFYFEKDGREAGMAARAEGQQS